MTRSGARYAAQLGVKEPRGVEMLQMKRDAGEVHGTVARPKDDRWVCLECRAADA
jgi:hypothetical protein